MDKYAVWVKASEMDIEYGKKYHAKRVDDEKIKWVGYFQESDGVFFWCNNPGYVPMPKDQRHLLLLLDESPVDRGVEKAEELTVSIQELAEQHCRDKDYSERQFEIGEESFIAGTKWAGNDADYWKQRCDFAEKLLDKFPTLVYDKSDIYTKWQSLKQKQL